MNISLIGMMGSGKTTIGKLLAKELSYSFVDTDFLIVEKENRSINDIFSNSGESYFRNAESNILKEALNNQNQIISTGGGIIKTNENIKLLKEKSLVIYLKANEETLFNRLKEDTTRPLLNVSDIKEKINVLLTERQAQYEQAHYTITTENKEPIEITQEIIGIINEYSRS